MDNFKIGDLVVQKDDFYSFLSNGRGYVVTSNCGDGFMYLDDFEVPVFSLDFYLKDKEKPDES